MSSAFLQRRARQRVFDVKGFGDMLDLNSRSCQASQDKFVLLRNEA